MPQPELDSDVPQMYHTSPKEDGTTPKEDM